jgi:hypothetical protein
MPGAGAADRISGSGAGGGEPRAGRSAAPSTQPEVVRAITIAPNERLIRRCQEDFLLEQRREAGSHVSTIEQGGYTG